MLYNPITNFESKVYSLDMRQFYTQRFMRGNLPHYTQELGAFYGDYFEGKNDCDDNFNMFVDDITHFIILPTQKPKNAVRYQP